MEDVFDELLQKTQQLRNEANKLIQERLLNSLREPLDIERYKNLFYSLLAYYDYSRIEAAINLLSVDDGDKAMLLDMLEQFGFEYIQMEEAADARTFNRFDF
ncbi:hypothetical protein [Gallibacterium anatis]|uniref:hypothetical protein n=1 Tax=Gallibacterium anatis TaxID=750 RepID=UPI00266F2E20|nr:hypothetical protein [Gallibacterium anatis]WKS98344.1 hypothetical protein NYR19_06135 [Gallibacterium anatis]